MSEERNHRKSALPPGEADQSGQKNRDLADLLGLGPSVDEDEPRVPDTPPRPEATDEVPQPGDKEGRGSKSISGPIRDSVPGDQTSGEGHTLWMDTPKKFPGVMESLRLVKNKLFYLKSEHDLKTYILTGADPRIGTSTIACNLAVLIARDLIEERILLVDTNLIYPTLQKIFNLSLQPGLVDYLFSGLAMREIVNHSSLSNLDLVTVGRFEDQVTSPFDLERFAKFMTEARQNYDLILLDSPPILRSSHCRILSPKVDGVILVAEANNTRWEVLLEIKRQLEKDGARLIGGILNKRRFVIPKWVYRFI